MGREDVTDRVREGNRRGGRAGAAFRLWVRACAYLYSPVLFPLEESSEEAAPPARCAVCSFVHSSKHWVTAPWATRAALLNTGPQLFVAAHVASAFFALSHAHACASHAERSPRRPLPLLLHGVVHVARTSCVVAASPASAGAHLLSAPGIETSPVFVHTRPDAQLGNARPVLSSKPPQVAPSCANASSCAETETAATRAASM